ncbi:MAG: NifU family protein [Gemmatimonadales bacterium]
MPQTPTPLSVTAEPLDDARCKFIVNRPVVSQPGVVQKFGSEEEAEGSPVAQAVLAVPSVCEVVLSSNVVTAKKVGDLPWSALEPQVRYAIDTALHAAAPVSTAPGAPGPSDAPDDDAIYDTVSRLFDTQINPAVAQHGGRVDLVDVQEGVVVVRMMGGCQGCGMANVTLRQGIEAALRRSVPTVREVKDITDHSAGTNPYFAAGSK